MSEENNKNSSPLNEGINPFEDMSSSLSQIKLDTEWTQNNTEKPKILSSPPSESSLKSSSRITIKSVSLSSPDPLFALLPPSSRATRSTPSISKKGSITTIPTNEVKLESNEVLNKPKDNLAKETNPNPEVSEDDLPLINGIKKSISYTTPLQPLTNNEETFKIPPKGILPVFNISISNPRKVNDALNPYTMYRISTWTNSTAYKKKEFAVERRFRDFLWLYEQLSSNNQGIIVPPPPEKNAIGRFQDDFVESRRRSLEIMLKKITAHPLLYGDPDIKFFLESESFAIEVVQRKKETSKGLFKIFGDAVSNATASFTKFSEPDEWFESRKYQVDQLEVQLKALYKSVELVSKQRKHLGDDHLDFGEALVALASAEVNKGLSKHFLELGNLQKKLKDIQELQSKQDSSTIAATAELYLRSIASVKACFASRTKSYSSWQTLEIEYEKKQTALIKAQGSKARPDKCSQLQTEVNQLECKVIAAKNEFEDMSKLVKDELDRFDKEKIEDFQVGIEEFLEKMIVNQREIVKLWENFINSLNEANETNEASEITKSNNSNEETNEETNENPMVSNQPLMNKMESPMNKKNVLDTSGLHFSNPTSPDPLSPPKLYQAEDENVVPLSPPEDPATSIWG